MNLIQISILALVFAVVNVSIIRIIYINFSLLSLKIYLNLKINFIWNYKFYSAFNKIWLNKNGNIWGFWIGRIIYIYIYTFKVIAKDMMAKALWSLWYDFLRFTFIMVYCKHYC